MQKQQNLNLMLDIQEDLLDQHEQISSFIDRQRLKLANDSFSLSYKKNSSTKKMNSSKRKNQNQQLQDLLQSSTVIYGNLNTQKKRLFTDLSFFSKDHTHDHSIQDQYKEYQSKIQFERSRNKQLQQTLFEQKQKMVKKYLQQIMDEFKQLSQQNQQLRKLYKKQVGGGYKAIKNKIQPINTKIQQNGKNTVENYQNQNFTPKNLKTGRRSIATASVCTQNVLQNKSHIVMGKQRQFIGIGNGNFGPSKKLDMLRQPNKPLYCESSINIHAGQSLVPSPKKHKRRQSQLTQRKDYPGKQNYQNEYQFMFDNNGQYQMDSLQSGRMSQPGKMPKKQQYAKQNSNRMNDQKIHWAKRPSKGFPNKFNVQRQQSVQSQQEYLMMHNDSVNYISQPITTKNIFLQFLEQLLIQQKVQYCQLSEQINQDIHTQQNELPSINYNNITFIQRIEQQISNKNRKLRQLQEVINVYKLQIQQIMGTDIKIINSLMVQLLEVKGKYLQMQEKVNGMGGLVRQIQQKQSLKMNLISTIKQKILRKKKQQQNLNLKDQQISSINQDLENWQAFSIPQSLKKLFEILNININKRAKPLEYLNEIRNLPQNKQIFQPFDSKKRANANIKIKQVIDSIRQSRKKFNQVLKIYEGRISKLQQKLQKYKNNQQSRPQKGCQSNYESHKKQSQRKKP